MALARTVYLPSRQSPSSSGSAAPSGTAPRGVVVAVIIALTLALLGGAYLATGAGDHRYADDTQQSLD